jgi:hypothetical protein
MSPGSRIPQKESAAATKPTRATPQKAVAIAVDAAWGKDGTIHDLAETQPPVLSEGLNLIQMYVAIGPTWAIPWRKRTPAMMSLTVVSDIYGTSFWMWAPARVGGLAA